MKQCQIFVRCVGSKMNKLIVIGWMGNKIAFLNVSREEAIKRAKEDHDYTELDNPEFLKHHVYEFEFNDVFGSYDAYEAD